MIGHRGAPAERARRWAGALTLALLAGTLGVDDGAASARSMAGPSVTPDAFVYAPIEGGRTVVRWNGQAAGYTLPKAAQVLPGSFDGAGGGLFLYNPGPGIDGLLRIRVVDGKLSLSFRTFRVDGTYFPMLGDFDGNGTTDIWWLPDGFHGPASYLWTFRADGTHRSRLVSAGAEGDLLRAALPADVNLDGVTDVVWPFHAEVWIMRADGSHVRRGFGPTDQLGVTGLVAGNLGPDDGVTRRRAVVTLPEGRQRLHTFNLAGQSTWKELRGADPCCRFQQPVGGRFLAGTDTSLFLYGGQLPAGTEQLQSVTAGGNLVITPTPQLGKPYTAAVGDFDGNGYDDIQFWDRNGTTFRFTSDGTGFAKVDTPDIPARTRSFALDLTAS